MRNAVWVLVAGLALSACVAHEKQGDSAAAVGDWKTAYMEYKVALTEKSDTPGLREKFDQARKEVAVQSWSRAQGCEAQQDWTCALDETSFILRDLDPNHPGAIVLKNKASHMSAMQMVGSARDLGRSNKFEEAIAMLQKARSTASDPEVMNSAMAAQQEIVNNGAAQAEVHRKNREFEKAAALYEKIATVDARYSQQAREVAVERDAYQGVLYEEQAKQGDLAMKNNDFRAAQPFYREAEKIKPNGRAAQALSYTTSLIAADDAINARNFPAAETALRQAVATGQDHGMAANMLERVRVKPYRVAIKSVMINPARLDGNAWIGNTTPLFFRVANQVSNMATKSDFEHAAQTAMLLPTENQPNLRVEVVMPNGQVLASNPRNGVYAMYDGEFVVAGNGFDSRRVGFIVRAEKNNEEVGRIEVSYADLFSNKELSLNGQNIAQLRLEAQPAEGRQEGTFVAMTQITAGTPAAGTAVAAGANPAGTTTPAAGTTNGTVAPAGGTTTGTVTPAGGTTTQPAPVPAPTRSTTPGGKRATSPVKK